MIEDWHTILWWQENLEEIDPRILGPLAQSFPGAGKWPLL
jgi:hypothetical protein